MLDTDGKFFLGRVVDPTNGAKTDESLLYDPDDLTTHAVVVGMTGSGKTGLCIGLLEEAALNDIPAIMIDPKGDITNTLLHFPDLLPTDFEPWINADSARRDGKTTAQAAADTADLWRNGLAGWGIDSERIAALNKHVQYSVYTPGSDAGLPVSILATLAAPSIPWGQNKELLREQISGTVTALLGLVGLTDIDPVRSREHILLANIFEHAWSRGLDLTLQELIMQTQSPPFEKLGVFDVAAFFPDRDRFGLAMDLNNILAAPAFQAWIEGEPLDIGRMLYTPSGKPRHTIFYIAHLPETERMFFVTLLYSAVESWMRAQKGSTSLRALVYFDEIFGYLPPTANPPSKKPMLRMLKQARAFGVGMVLATQNPVDIDYKALSNAGTWFVGKLGTDQDKQRLLDGMMSAMGAGLSRREYDELISKLGKRVFLLRNVHEREPALFGTRWAMNYLAGPVMRNQIPALNALVGASAETTPPQATQATQMAAPVPAPTPAPAPEPALQMEGSRTSGKVPSTADEYYLPNNLTLAEAMRLEMRTLSDSAETVGILYRPMLLAQAEIRFTNRKYNLNSDVTRAALVESPDRRGSVRWQDHDNAAFDDRDFDRRSLPDAYFAALEAPLSESKTLTALKRDLLDWAYRNAEVMVRANDQLKVYAGPEVSAETFEDMCEDAAESKESAEIKKVAATFDRKIKALEKKLQREERELTEDEADLSARKREETGKHIETILGFFGGRRRSVSGSLSKRRMTAKAKMDVEESIAAIRDFKDELAQLAQDKMDAVTEIEDKWEEIVADITEIAVTPYKKDVAIALFGVAWFPYHVIAVDGRLIELPAYGSS